MMIKTLIPATTLLGALAVAAGALYADRTEAAAPPTWSSSDAEQRLTIGPWAVRNRVKYATCIGVGRAYGDRRYRSLLEYTRFNCETREASFENERQLVLVVTGPTTFRATWLTPPPPC